MNQEIVLSAIAVIAAAVLGALIAFYGNVRIKRMDLRSQKESERAEQRLRYYVPLLRFTYTLDRRIGHILTTLDTDWLSKEHLDKIKNREGFAIDPNPEVKGYFISSSLYIFACFFGWAEAIKLGVDPTRPFSYRNQLHKTLSRAKKKVYTRLEVPYVDKRAIFLFDPDISIVSKLFQYEELFKQYLISKTLVNPRDASRLDKQFQYSIGELMLERDGEEGLRCKSFREFFDCYVNDENFRWWFTRLENLFVDLCNFERGKELETQVQLKNDIRPLRLLAIRYWCRVLMQHISDELDIETLPPGDVLVGISKELTNIIKSVEIEKLESYLVGVRISNE